MTLEELKQRSGGPYFDRYLLLQQELYNLHIISSYFFSGGDAASFQEKLISLELQDWAWLKR